jgi:hypothetical protein
MQALKFNNWKKYGEFIRKIRFLWISEITWIFLIILVISSAYLIYVWYFFVLNSSWSEEKKQAYVNAHGKEVTLDERKFNSVVENYAQRKEKYDLKNEGVNDIFQLK